MSRELENRFYLFAKNVRDFCRTLNFDPVNLIYIRQLVRASSSIGANYLEASDDLGKSDEKMKIRIARREAKETLYWLSLIIITDEQESARKKLLNECQQIRKILSAVLIK